MPARYVFAVLGSIGFAIIYGLKVNLSVAIVAMVNHTALAALPLQHSGAPLARAGAHAAHANLTAECAPESSSEETLVSECLLGTQERWFK